LEKISHLHYDVMPGERKNSFDGKKGFTERCVIIDIHSHVWEYPRHFDDSFREQARRARAGVEVDLTVRYDEYQAAATPETRTVVFGGKARLSGLWVDDEYVARCVSQHANQLIGFLSVDPTQNGWQEEMRDGHERLGLKGIKLMPMYAGFFPNDSLLDPLWEYATQHSLPVLLHTGTTFIAQAPLECTLPRHLDAVAARFPEARIILAHLGHPYEYEAVAVIRKHPNVFSDISALHYRPWQLYNSLMLVQEYGVWNKLLFGTDYPFTTVDATLKGLRTLNDMVQGTNLPRLDEEQIEAMIYRDSLSLLGVQAD
jgi:predicted TIM-barrel fold metal-dependent hydrolase